MDKNEFKLRLLEIIVNSGTSNKYVPSSSVQDPLPILDKWCKHLYKEEKKVVPATPKKMGRPKVVK